MDHIPSYESNVQRESNKEHESRGFHFNQEPRLPYYAPTSGRQLRNNLHLNIEGGGAYGDSTEARRDWQASVHIAGNSLVGGEDQTFLAAGRGGYNGNLLALEERDMIGRGSRSKGGSLEILEYGIGLGMGDANERWDTRVQASEDRVSVQRGGEREQGNWNQSKQRILEGGGDTVGYGDFADSPEAAGIRCMYRDCQKNQAPERGTHSVDGCGEFLPEGREGKSGLTCAACGCHRNFHRRVKVGEDDREEERGRGAVEGHPNASIGTIESVAQKLMEAASRAIPLLSFDPRTGRAGDINAMEHNTFTRILVENLDHIAKVTLSTAECLTLLQKSSTRHSSSSRDRDNRARATSPLAGHPRGPFSSEVSPVSTVEKRVHTPPPFSLQQFNTNNQQAVEIPTSLHLNAVTASGGAQQQAADPGSKFKRKRTRISEKQKVKLTAFGEQAGWTVVGQRKETIDAACADIGVEPKTLKYWIHNSKQKLKRPEETNVLGC